MSDATTAWDRAREAMSCAIEDRLRAYPEKTALSGTVGWGASTDELADVGLAAAVPVLLEALLEKCVAMATRIPSPFADNIVSVVRRFAAEVQR